jgi:Response regulator consisting of a CheY-like receiver domain and a Fis-type HTH domain
MSTNDKHLLIVEDDETFSFALTTALEKKGFAVFKSNSIENAIHIANQCIPEFALVDLRIGNDSGLQIIPVLIKLNSKVRIVVLTGYASIATAVEAIKLGAIQYLTKPASSDEIYQAFFKQDGNLEQPLQANPMSVKRLEWEHIQKVLNENDGNLSATARALGMHRRTLQRKLSKKPSKK